MFVTLIAVFYSADSQTKMNDVFVDINFVSTFTVHWESNPTMSFPTPSGLSASQVLMRYTNVTNRCLSVQSILLEVCRWCILYSISVFPESALCIWDKSRPIKINIHVIYKDFPSIFSVVVIITDLRISLPLV